MIPGDKWRRCSTRCSTHTHTHTHTHTRTHTHAHTHTHTHTHTHHAHPLTNTITNTHTRTSKKCKHVRTGKYTHACAHVLVHTSEHKHDTCMHTCLQPRLGDNHCWSSLFIHVEYYVYSGYNRSQPFLFLYHAQVDARWLDTMRDLASPLADMISQASERDEVVSVSATSSALLQQEGSFASPGDTVHAPCQHKALSLCVCVYSSSTRACGKVVAMGESGLYLIQIWFRHRPKLQCALTDGKLSRQLQVPT